MLISRLLELIYEKAREKKNNSARHSRWVIFNQVLHVAASASDLSAPGMSRIQQYFHSSIFLVLNNARL